MRKVRIVAKDSTHYGEVGTALPRDDYRVLNHSLNKGVGESWRQQWEVFVLGLDEAGNTPTGFFEDEVEDID